MSIGLGIFLIVVGAIFAFALSVQVDWIDLQLVGYICLIAGVLVTILGIVSAGASSPEPDDLAHLDRPGGRGARRLDRSESDPLP